MLLTRYFYREVLSTTLALVSILILIFLSHWFIRYLGQASSGLLPRDFIVELMFLRLLMALDTLLPLGFFLSILLVLGRLYTDNEIVAMNACGMGTPFMLKRFALLSSLIAILVGVLSFVLVPWAEAQDDRLMIEAKKLSDIAGIAAGHFQEFSHGQGVFYVESLDNDGHTMRHVFAAFDNGDKSIVVNAETATQTLETPYQVRYMNLFNGSRYEGQPGQSEADVLTFKEHGMRIDPPSQIYHQGDLGSAPTLSLWAPDNAAKMAELHMRIAAPIGTVLLTLLAVLMSYTRPRQGRYGKVIMAILVYFTYGNLLQIAQAWVENEKLPIWMGLWWVHLGLLLAVLGLFFWRKHQRLL